MTLDMFGFGLKRLPRIVGVRTVRLERLDGFQLHHTFQGFGG